MTVRPANIQGDVLPYKGIMPQIAADSFIAQGARVIGDVVIGAQSSVWFNCVLRGDVNIIRMGERSNIQDGTIVHVTEGGASTHIGNGVLIGHQCLLHGCTLEDDVLIGMGSTLMDDVVVETGAMIAAGSLVTPGKRVASGHLWGGRPARYMRDLREEETAHNRHLLNGYVIRRAEYIDENS